ncbi:MAG: aspartate-semialdehyde dehydrogenase [Holosporales bacterium]
MRVVVVGATGNVGRETLQVLAERNFPAQEVIALASDRSARVEVSYGEEKILKVQPLSQFDFKGTDVAFFCAGSKVSSEWAPKAAAAGAIVIDKSSYFRMHEDVPLVVPEVNAAQVQALGATAKGRMIANPNCVAIPLVMALKPLHDLAGLKRVVISSYQSVSGAGKDAMDELFNQSRAIFVGDAPKVEHLPKQIAFNLLPHIGGFLKDGRTDEEAKIEEETSKILGLNVPLSATCVRVPVFIGHSISVNAEFERPLTATQARNALGRMPGVLVLDAPEREIYVTPLEVVGEDAVVVSRIREDRSQANTLNFWVSADNLRKGAALNAVQIAESCIR